MNTKINIDNKLIFKDFDDHINIEGNDRILFSAPFGTGKSTFLTEYFEENTDKYFCFNLYPVNYSVSQNEDIFELIKFDLLLQLMGNYRNEIELKNEDLSNILSFQALFLKEIKLTPILLALLEEGGKIGKSAKILIDEVKKQYDNYKKQFNDEEKFIQQYLEQIENKVGNVNEMDAYSTIILNLLERVEKRFPDKQSVLIIDDLDRLDPEHIFRLFNIFSLNFGKEKILNKFGFDKIIFVCDIENIRNIYAHKYGENVDFKGYIDKFFSYEPYTFDNERLVVKKIELIINSLKSSKINFEEDVSKILFFSLKSILTYLLKIKKINLRSLISVKPIIKEKEFNYMLKSYMTNTADFKLLLLFNILKSFGFTYKELKGIFDSNSEKNKILEFSSYDYVHGSKSLVSICLPFLIEIDTKKGDFINFEKDGSDFSIYNSYFNCYFNSSKFISISLNDFDNYSLKNITMDKEGKNEIELPPFKILSFAFDECVKRGAISL